MTLYGEVISKGKELSQAEKRALLRVLADSLGEETAQPEHRHQDGSYQAGIIKPARDSTLSRVLGALRQEGQPAPTDDEAEHMLAARTHQRLRLRIVTPFRGNILEESAFCLDTEDYL